MPLALFTGPNEVDALRAYLNTIVNYLNSPSASFPDNVSIVGDLAVGGNAAITGTTLLTGLVTIGTGAVPDANDGAYLGTTSLGFSDLFLASGGVINWANGAGTISLSTHMLINSGTTATDIAGDTIRLNSITNIGTANSFIGFQSKPAQGASTAQNIIGAEISPRLNDTFALTGTGTIIGMHVDTYLRGTTGNVAGDVRGQQIEMVTDDAGTRTVTGNVSGLRFRTAWSGTITGDMEAIRIEAPEAQTNSKTYDSVLTLTGTVAGVWNDAPATEPTTADGYIKVIVNGNARYIQLYSGAPID